MMQQIADHQALLKTLGLAFKGDPFTPFQTDTSDPTASNPADAERGLLIAIARRLLVGTMPDA